jgi:hypothetical protein
MITQLNILFVNWKAFKIYIQHDLVQFYIQDKSSTQLYQAWKNWSSRSKPTISTDALCIFFKVDYG